MYQLKNLYSSLLLSTAVRRHPPKSANHPGKKVSKKMAKILKRHIRNLLFRFISRNVRIVVHKVISTFNGRLTSSYFVYRQNQLLIISLGVRKSSFLKVATPSVSITAKHDKQFCTCQVVFARNITYLCLGLFQYLREK